MNANIFKSLAVMALATCFSCQRQTEKGFSDTELNIINGSDSIMRVLTIEDESDLEILRSSSTALSLAALQSDEYDRLAEVFEHEAESRGGEIPSRP